MTMLHAFAPPPIMKQMPVMAVLPSRAVSASKPMKGIRILSGSCVANVAQVHAASCHQGEEACVLAPHGTDSESDSVGLMLCVDDTRRKS